MKNLPNATLSCALFLFAHQAAAASVALDFHSLPSAQGWVYFSEGPPVPESSVFSVDGSGTLTMNSSVTNAAYYSLKGALDPSLSFQLVSTARSLSGDTALAFYVMAAGKGAAVHLAPDSITVLANGNWLTVPGVDNTNFSEFKLVGSFSGNFSFYKDGSLIYTAPMENLGSLSTNQLDLGDGGSLGSGVAQISSYVLTQPVPEPTIQLLLGIGIAIIVLGRNYKAMSSSGT